MTEDWTGDKINAVHRNDHFWIRSKITGMRQKTKQNKTKQNPKTKTNQQQTNDRGGLLDLFLPGPNFAWLPFLNSRF